MKRLSKILLALAMSLGLCACGKSGEKLDATYGIIYDNTTASTETLPDFHFLPENAKTAIADGMTLEVTLVLESVGDYTLVADLRNANQEDKTASDYLYVHVGVIGQYTKEGDVITLTAPEWGGTSFAAGSDYAETYGAFNLTGDTTGIEKLSEEIPEILNYVTEGTTFTVDGMSIVSWTLGE